ncbi:MAG: phage holin family protein [Clostridium sp.]|nr:phage holin family protein [Clostridium sp.]
MSILYIIGMIIKNTDKISDKYIPLILLVFGIAGSMGIIGVNANAVIQGVLVTGATVYTNQLIKQTGKDK